MQAADPLDPPSPQGVGDQLRWHALHGAARGIALAALARRHRLVVVCTRDPVVAGRLTEELRFFATDRPVLHLPDWETLPYDRFSPWQDIISERLEVLATLAGGAPEGVLVVPVGTALQRLAPPAFVLGSTFSIRLGDRIDVEAFRGRLIRAGYRCVGQVQEHGEFAVRGALVDLYPMGSALPYRLDLFDDEVETLRTFDPETQRSLEKVEALRLLPAREFPLTEEAIALFRSQWRRRFEGRAIDCPIYKDVSQGLAPAGIEYWLPLFFERPATLFDYLPEDAVMVLDADVHDAALRHWDEVGERYEQHRHDVERPLLAPEEIHLRVEEFMGAVKRFACVRIAETDGDAELASDPAVLGARGASVFATRPPPPLPVDGRSAEPLAALLRFLQAFDGRVLFLAESAGRREALLELFATRDLRPVQVAGWEAFLGGGARIAIGTAPIETGALLPARGLLLVTESQLFGERVSQRRQRKRSGRDAESILRDLSELTIGAPVVHEQHGIGRYRGLVTLEAGGVVGEFLLIEYADADKLYVPVAALHYVSRWAGLDPEHAPLHKLGSGAWQKARARAAQRVHDVAAELLDLHARRAARQGHRFEIDRDAYRAFAQGFPFEETPDQQAAIEAVLADMAAPRPMDRLVCGDVGFGKTEVAMRAAFVAVNGGRQVAVLVPTTLLAQQHAQNFRDRFADWPVRVESLSRFRSRKDEAAVMEGLADGRIDLVIGTHKLLAEGVRFKRLGLLIVDEEHRFGVRQKERLKALRADVDILTLTATPIPRTLGMALAGTRELSIIATPPARRIAIKTFVRPWNPALLREALAREIGRGGQVYFLHNDIEDIEAVAREVELLAPQARVRIAHGQMPERELERVMLDFYHQRFNVLVCTTIIETGIDVPSANTIIIDRADRFGLAQLYQLRGRVGRSHHRAYAYLLVPSVEKLAGDARKRLEAIEALEELGVGFTVATHDMEIRGAGEILGDEQSGHIQEIGFGLYGELLERAVAALRAGREPELERPLEHGPEIDLRLPALIPADYLPDVHARLILYKRVATAGTADELADLEVETIDRFGLMPEAARHLFAIARLKLRAAPLGVRKVEMGPEGGRVLFAADARVDPAALLALVQSDPRHYRFEGGDRLRLMRAVPEPVERIALLGRILDALAVRRAARDAVV